MCVIVYKPTGVPLPDKQVLTACALQNPDGFGLVAHNGKMRHIYKNVTLDPESVASCITDHVSQHDTALIHFRLATHGNVTLANAHPFPVPGSDLVMMHNGVLQADTLALNVGKGTDSEAFAKQYLTRIVGNSERALDRIRANNRKIRDLISGDKLAFMDRRGKVRIVNHARGTLIGRCWYSNTHWRGWDYSDNWQTLDFDAPAQDNYTLWLDTLDVLDAGGYADAITREQFDAWIARVGSRYAEDCLYDCSPIDLVCEILGF